MMAYEIPTVTFLFKEREFSIDEVVGTSMNNFVADPPCNGGGGGGKPRPRS